MSHAHVCDECKTVAAIGEAIGWWRLEEIADPISILPLGLKPEYHFCSWQCAIATMQRTLHIQQERA